MKLLDTDHCVAILRGKLDLRTVPAARAELALSTISVAELSHGVYRSERRDENAAQLSIFLTGFNILAFDYQTALVFGRIKADLEAKGQRVADLDLQIASVALANQIPLVTHNTRHFQRIPGLTLEDWLG